MILDALFKPDVKQLDPTGDSNFGKQRIRSKTLFIRPVSIISSRNSRRHISMSLKNLEVQNQLPLFLYKKNSTISVVKYKLVAI